MQDLITHKIAGGTVLGSGALTSVTFLADILPEFQALAAVGSTVCAIAGAWFYIEGALQKRRDRKSEDE